jgi:hypothetical protein
LKFESFNLICHATPLLIRASAHLRSNLLGKEWCPLSTTVNAMLGDYDALDHLPHPAQAHLNFLAQTRDRAEKSFWFLH